MDSIVINITEGPVQQVTQNLQASVPDQVTINLSSPDSIPRGGAIGQVLAKSGNGDYATHWVTIALPNPGATRIAYGDPITGLLTASDNFTYRESGGGRYAAIGTVLIGALDSLSESFIQGTGYDKLSILGNNSGVSINLFGNSGHIDYGATTHNILSSGGTGLRIESAVRTASILGTAQDFHLNFYNDGALKYQINVDGSDLFRINKSGAAGELVIAPGFLGVNSAFPDGLNNFIVDGDSWFNGKFVVKNTFDSPGNQTESTILIEQANSTTRNLQLQSDSDGCFVIANAGPLYIDVSSSDLNLRTYQLGNSINFIVGALYANSVRGTISSSSIHFTTPTFTIDNQAGAMFYFGADGGIDYLSISGQVGPVFTRGLFTNNNSYTAFNSPDTLYLMVKATPVLVSTNGGATVIYDANGFNAGYTAQITLGPNFDPIDYYTRNYHNFRGDVTLNNKVSMPALQVGNAGLLSGMLYIDTAANILANGDKVVGYKV